MYDELFSRARASIHSSLGSGAAATLCLISAGLSLPQTENAPSDHQNPQLAPALSVIATGYTFSSHAMCAVVTACFE